MASSRWLGLDCRTETFAHLRADMGIYDRDYQRTGYDDRQPGFYLGAPRMMTTNIILVTCVLYAVQLMAGQSYVNAFELHADWFRRPWIAYQLLTYGFLHDPTNLWHIVLNMFGLFMFGREVELRYGRREYLIFYLAAIVIAGLTWTVATIPSLAEATAQNEIPRALGASGGVIAVVILFAFNFPYRTVLLMFFLPMPMWVAAAIFVLIDALGAMRVRDAGGVAVTAHLGGALFAFLYYQWGGRLERLTPSGSVLARLRPRPKLHVHDPDEDEASSTDSRVDEILKKIQEHGQDSLTRGERRILEEASREYQKKRQ
jgi:membrane associated rhomboid family serine protease